MSEDDERERKRQEKAHRKRIGKILAKGVLSASRMKNDPKKALLHHRSSTIDLDFNVSQVE
jgi:hypothetical protein